MNDLIPKSIIRKTLVGLHIAIAVGAADVACPGEGHPADSTQPQELNAGAPVQPNQQPEANRGTSGMTIYVDPRTGAILSGPAPGTVPLQVPAHLQRSFSTAHQGLVEVPNPLPGGGVTLDLQGRFMTPLFATIDSNGKPTILHLHDARGSREEK